VNVCVLGLWHLGAVTTACLAEAGHSVVGIDFDLDVVEELKSGKMPVFEPGLVELTAKGVQEKRLRFSTDIAGACVGSDIVWVTYDTPVDENDEADVEFVLERVRRTFPHLKDGALVLVSSQVPVGTVRRMERLCSESFPDKRISFACSPENLRLGSAISAFNSPDRIIAGYRTEADRRLLSELFHPISENIEWMSVESAELTKHAINAFLATSVVFINEISAISGAAGADAGEVERGLKSESRIGPKAYLKPGAAFAGGTLARDIAFLNAYGQQHGVPTHFLTAVRTSNDAHKKWIQRKLLSIHPLLDGRIISVWGLTYKPNTDTLRRSSAVELCRWLARQGAVVKAHDPAVKNIPDDLRQKILLCTSAEATLEKSSALIIATEWPDYKEIQIRQLEENMQKTIVIDPTGFLEGGIGQAPTVRYFKVGKAYPQDSSRQTIKEPK